MRRRRRQFDALRMKLPPYSNSEVSERIDELIHDAADREMLKAKLIDNLTLEQISEMQDRPFSTVRDHFYRHLRTIFGHNTYMRRKDKRPPSVR